MTVQFARPRIAELTFQVFERSVHPELLSAFAHRQFWQDDYLAEVRIGEAGHHVEFRHARGAVAEVATSREQLLPKRFRSFRQKLAGSRERSVRFDSGVNYCVSFHIEKLDPDSYLNFHQELLVDCMRAEVSHSFPSGTRFSPEPLSLLRVDSQSDSLLVYAYHTFPDDCAVVKSQSLFELV